jgi:hypothetical protein
MLIVDVGFLIWKAMGKRESYYAKATKDKKVRKGEK